jgi:hypothetical protein
MKTFEEILNEDLTYQQGMTSSMDWTSKTVPSNVSLADILRMSNPQFSRTGSMVNFPNELSNVQDHIQKTSLDISSLLNVYKQTLKNPIIKNDKFKTHIIELNIQRYERVLKLFKEIYDDLEHLSLDSK